MDKIPMTAAGYAALEAELKHRQQVERPRIIQQITDARTHGDLSENAEYHAAKEQQSLNEGRIAELEDKLARAEVIDVSKLSGDTIKFGATVTLVDEDTDEKKVWQIVGEPEADAKSRQDFDHLAARARADRQDQGRAVEVTTPGRRQGLRGEEGRVALAPAPAHQTNARPGLPRSFACAALAAPALALTNYFLRRLRAPAGLNEPPIYLVYKASLSRQQASDDRVGFRRLDR